MSEWSIRFFRGHVYLKPGHFVSPGMMHARKKRGDVLDVCSGWTCDVEYLFIPSSFCHVWELTTDYREPGRNGAKMTCYFL